MRHTKKWIAGGTLTVAVAAAIGAAVPAMAQQSSGHHQAPTLVATSGKPDFAHVTMATAEPVSTVPVIIGQSGTTGLPPG